jgi:hypothetical protein
MALVINDKYIFLHIPKTGGNSFREFIDANISLKQREIGQKHATYDYLCGNYGGYFKFYGHKLKRYFKIYESKIENLIPVTIIRNPINWYESWYKYQKARSSFNNGGYITKWGDMNSLTNWHVMSVLNDIKFDSFDSFVNEILERNPNFVSQLYYRYIIHPQTIILKLENLVIDFRKEISKLSINQNELSLNYFPRIRPSEINELVWKEKTLDKLLNAEKFFFNKYDYHVIR